MKLNRERIACGLSLLIMVIGVYGLTSSRILTAPPPRIDTNIPVSSQKTPQIEPRLYFEDSGGGNPFKPSSDWARITPADLPAPVPEPSRWLVVPLGKSADPADVGFAFLRDPPAEAKEDDEKGSAPKEASGGQKP